MDIYDHLSSIYDKWCSADSTYQDSGRFYVSALSQMKNGRYLELGIGTGRISLEVIRSAPISVTGVDISEQMLAVCREKYNALSERKGTLHLRRGDVTQLTYHEEFDGAVMPYRAIEHLLTEDDIRSLFRVVFSALKPGGWFLLDHLLSNHEMGQPELAGCPNHERVIAYQDAETTISDYYEYDFERRLLHEKVFANSELLVCFDFHLLEAGEIKTYAEQAGFEVLSLMGDFDGAPLTERADKQIIFLRKPGFSADIQLPVLNAEQDDAIRYSSLKEDGIIM